MKTLTALIFLLAALAAGFGQNNASNASRLRHAAALLSAGNLNGAETELQSALRVSPKDHLALDLLGVVRVLQHRETDAQILFQKAIQSKPDFAGAHAHLGLLYAQIRQDGDAIPELQTAIHLDPARTDAADALVHIFREHAQEADSGRDSKQALGLLIEARKIAPKNPDVEFEFATAAFKMSLLQDAVEGFEQTLMQRKDDALAIYGLGRAYGGLGKLEEARQQFMHYVALRPDDPSGYCSLGMTLAALDRPEEARREFAKSISLAPQQTEAYFRRGVLELQANNLDQGMSDLQIVLNRDPKHAGALSASGKAEFLRKHYPEATGLLERALAAEDSLSEAHYYLGLTYTRMGRKEEGDRELQRATQLQREDVEKRRAVWNRLDLPPATTKDQQ